MNRSITALSAVFLVLLIALLAVTVSAAGEACEGCTYGEFNGSPACMYEGNLHICRTNFAEWLDQTVRDTIAAEQGYYDMLEHPTERTEPAETYEAAIPGMQQQSVDGFGYSGLCRAGEAELFVESVGDFGCFRMWKAGRLIVCREPHFRLESGKEYKADTVGAGPYRADRTGNVAVQQQ